MSDERSGTDAEWHVRYKRWHFDELQSVIAGVQRNANEEKPDEKVIKSSGGGQRVESVENVAVEMSELECTSTDDGREREECGSARCHSREYRRKEFSCAYDEARSELEAIQDTVEDILYL